MQFSNLQKKDYRTYTFTLSPIHVTYANTLRRLILTGVQTVAFRSDMTSTGSTTDVIVKKNDTPMTNEMLADRIGLLPIYVADPSTWKDNSYLFTLKVTGDKDSTTYVKSSHFKITKISENLDWNSSGGGNNTNNDNNNMINNNDYNISNNSNNNSNISNSNISNSNINNSNISNSNNEEEVVVATEIFFPPNPITRDTCLIATLQPGNIPQSIEIVAKASKGTGREHARFCPVSQCSYEYTLDPNPQRIEEMFAKWLTVTKKVGAIDKASNRYEELKREFNTMQIKRCYQIDEKGEPFSYDFTVESAGVLDVPYIVEQACQVGENMCSRYVTLGQGDVPADITITSADTRIIGFDFLFRGHEHTLGNLLQTWLVQNHIEGNAEPRITYAGYAVPHPLRDEMLLRIGVEDGEESTARMAIAEAAKGCVQMFQEMRAAWRNAIGAPLLKGIETSKPLRKKVPSVGKPQVGTPAQS